MKLLTGTRSHQVFNTYKSYTAESIDFVGLIGNHNLHLHPPGSVITRSHIPGVRLNFFGLCHFSFLFFSPHHFRPPSSHGGTVGKRQFLVMKGNFFLPYPNVFQFSSALNGCLDDLGGWRRSVLLVWRDTRDWD